MPAVRGVEWGKPHETVHSFLRAKIPEGIFTVDGNGHTLDTCLFPFGDIEDFCFIAALCRPAQVDALEHRCPILRIGAARPGMNGKDGRVMIMLAREHCCE